MNVIITYVASFVAFILIDFTWLGFIAKKFYAKHIGHLLTKDVVWSAAIVFYFMYVAGVYYFAIAPAIEKGELSLALRNGVLLGLLCYATYDFTNMATLQNWSWTVVVVDVIWGGVLTGAVAVVGFLVGSRL
jgi:uncharacterized membrane protein